MRQRCLVLTKPYWLGMTSRAGAPWSPSSGWPSRRSPMSKPAERHRHFARVEGHTLQNALRLRGSDGILQARRCHTRIHYDGIAALGLFEIRLERASAEAFGKRQRFGAVARIVDEPGAQREGGLHGIERDALASVTHDQDVCPGQ